MRKIAPPQVFDPRTIQMIVLKRNIKKWDVRVGTGVI
jgi:hypothetical protein